MVLVQEFVYQQSAHHETMLRPNYIHYAAAWQSNFYLIVDHFNGTWNELTLEELFQLSQRTGRHALDRWRSLIQQLELSHELPNDRIEILLHTFIQLVQPLIDCEDFMQLTAVVFIDIFLQIFLQLLRELKEGILD